MIFFCFSTQRSAKGVLGDSDKALRNSLAEPDSHTENVRVWLRETKSVRDGFQRSIRGCAVLILHQVSQFRSLRNYVSSEGPAQLSTSCSDEKLGGGGGGWEQGYTHKEERQALLLSGCWNIRCHVKMGSSKFT